MALMGFREATTSEENRLKNGSRDKSAGSRSVGRPRKSWIDTVKDCLKKRGLDVRKARRIVHDRSYGGDS